MWGKTAAPRSGMDVSLVFEEKKNMLRNGIKWLANSGEKKSHPAKFLTFEKELKKKVTAWYGGECL